MSSNLTRNRAVTLMELLAAMMMFSVIILYFAALEQIGRRTTLLTERRIQVQNEASYVLEHLRKQMLDIIGYKNMKLLDNTNINPIFIENRAGPKRKVIRFWVDHDHDGRFNPDNTAHDWILCYGLRTTGSRLAFDNHANTYDAGRNCTGENISDRITDFTINEPSTGLIQRSPFNLSKTYITLTVTACWDPQETYGPCGDESEAAKNPQVSMQTTLTMPGVSLW